MTLALLLLLLAPPPDTWQQAVAAYRNDHYAEARQLLQGLTGAAPQALLGICEFEMQDYGQARIHLDAAVRAGLPQDPELAQVARLYHGWSALLASDFESAIQTMHALPPVPAHVNLREITAGLALARLPLTPAQARSVLEPERWQQIRTLGRQELLRRPTSK